MLPRRSLLEGSPDPAALEPLIDAAERALRTWEPVWSEFVDARLREEAESLLGGLSELALSSHGGHAGAERRLLLLQRAEAAVDPATLPPPLQGLEILGNFLFDPADGADFRQALVDLGAAPGELGELWLRGERGAQAIVSEGLAGRLDGRAAMVRTVEVRLATLPLTDLQLPAQRAPRSFTSVEASLRLDAVASAGFGLSRNRMAELIRQGVVRIDWQPVTSPSRELLVGNRVQLEGRGELEIQAIDRTKRDRYRVRLERR